jgi:hypothetical protein
MLIAGDEERGPIRCEFKWGPASQPDPAPVIDAAPETESDDTANGAITITWTGE